MATASVRINPAYLPALTSLLDQRIGDEVRQMAAEVRTLISTAFPPASEPGEPPHRRTGGLRESVFVERIGPGDWAYGYNAVTHDPARPSDDRSDLGIWMELGTGSFRHAPGIDGKIRAFPSGGLTSVQPRPALLPVLFQHVANVASNAGAP